MFGLGAGELIFLLLLALLILGPKKLPEAAANLGKAIRSFRRATRELTDHIEIDETVRRPLRELQAAIADDPPPPVPPKDVVSSETPPKPNVASDKLRG